MKFGECRDEAKIDRIASLVIVFHVAHSNGGNSASNSIACDSLAENFAGELVDKKR
jgi:hypothetical protein